MGSVIQICFRNADPEGGTYAKKKKMGSQPLVEACFMGSSQPITSWHFLFKIKKIASEEDLALINSIYYFARSFLIETICKGTKLHFKLVNYSTICNEIKRRLFFYKKNSLI
jgi:hypothetical protein